MLAWSREKKPVQPMVKYPLKVHIEVLSILKGRVDGLKSVTMTDKDGVAIIKSVTNNASIKTFEHILSATFGVISDQASKLGLKENKSIISLYGIYQVIQFNHAPLITILIADSEANTGVLLDLGNELKEIADLISATLIERQTSAT
ncbi:4825_t:CDS:2 [Entrophospora sp. SA101]|nr:4825_t:CDS:2 [Entrophospora sp. SA101]